MLYFCLKKYTENNLDILENEIKKDKLPNKAGLRQRTLKLKRKWQEKLENVLSCHTRTSVEMSWLNDNGEVNERFMNANIVEKIFKSDGIPIIKSNDFCQRNGKKHVVLIKDEQTQSRLAYLKFYPDYPLRQQAVDELCLRLSGHGLMSSLVKLTHKKQPNRPYPVLFSEPLGFDASSPTLNENLSKLNEIEANIDMYLYSWKFLETFVIRPREEKPDNVAVNKDETSGKYFYISFDNDVTFGHRRYTCEQPNAYSIIYLTNQMELSFDHQIVKELLYLDFEMLFSEWIDEFKLKNKNLFRHNCLFDSNELSLIKK